jgi:DNA-directed RNA polymerase II subunit RPB1
MNAHIPQSYEAATELEEIAAVPMQIISPRFGTPVIGAVQDTLVGSYRITRPGIEFTRREFMNLMMWNKRFTGILPKPKGGAGGADRWTGHQVISQLLPPINMDMPNNRYKDDKSEANMVKIREGEVLQGTFDKSIFSKPSKGIVHVTYNDYGPTATVNLLDALQTTIEQFLVYNGFSVGISDLVADADTRKRMDDEIQARKKEVEDILLQIHLDLFDNNTGKSNQEEFEAKVFTALNKANSEAGKIGQRSLAEENRMVAMVRAGSKGNEINISQMIACVGQIAIEGRRIGYGFSDRTLPHYKKYDDGAEARGFVESSFIRGLTPQEFFFHAMSGREGLIDTAVKTADTGYIQRQLIKAMEDLTTQFDGTVRDAKMNIIQFHYGEDGVNSTKIEAASLGLAKLSDAQIQKEYGMEGVDWSSVLKEGSVMDVNQEAITKYVSTIKEDRSMLVEGMNHGKMESSLYAPVNLERAIMNMKVKFGLNKDSKTDLTPSYVLEGIQKVIARTLPFHRLWCALVRFHCAPHKLIVAERFTKIAFDALCEMLVLKNWQSWVQPGEQVGILAAQSIGEPATQMTLNTFHLAGVAAKSNMTRGVPRLKELLKVTQNPKATSLTVFLKPEFRSKKEKAREVAQDLELTLLHDICTKSAIYFDPVDEATVLPEDRDLINFYKVFNAQSNPEEGQAVAGSSGGAAGTPAEATPAWSKWLLRLELDREKMFNKNISMDDIAFVLNDIFESQINTIYSDFNSTKLVMRIKLLATDNESTDDFMNLKKFQNKILNSIVIRGVPGIKAVTFRKEEGYVELVNGEYKTVTQYVLDTDGSNFMEVMNHPAVDGHRLMSSHVHDIFENLGIEATRSILLNEMSELFEDAGVNYRHLGLLCDVMTRAGRMMSVDRYGINKNDIGPLAKASFEETEKILKKAAFFGEVDPVTGVSANIMMGQTIRGGTAFSQVLLDEAALLRLMQGLPPLPGGAEDTVEADEPELTQAEIDAELYESPDDKCSTAQLKMNIALPPAATLLEEPDTALHILEDE